jgi:hypothetical protein
MNLLDQGGYYQWIGYKIHPNTEGKLMARLTEFHHQQRVGSTGGVRPLGGTLRLLGAVHGSRSPRHCGRPPVLEEGVDVYRRKDGVDVGGETQGRLLTPPQPRPPWESHRVLTDELVWVLEVRDGETVRHPLVLPCDNH